MVIFFLLVMIAIVASSVWITQRFLGNDSRPARPAQTQVPLDDAPPGVLDAIARQLRQHPDTA